MPSNASAFSHMLMQILLLCRHPAADVPLGLVDVQHLARLRRERRVDLRKTLGDVLMYRTLADPEMFCRLPHGRIIVNDISGNLHGSFLNITFQTKSPAILVFTLYAGLFSYILSLSDVKEDIAMPFINTKTTVSLSKSKKDSLTAEICRITRECLGKGENWVMTGFEDNASLFFQGDSAAVAYVEVKTFGTPSAAGTSQMTGKLCHLLSGELSIPADHIYVAYFPTDNWGWNGSNF